VPEIPSHSKAKHLILEDYLENWLVTVCGNHRGQSGTVTLIDGFCGGGRYRDITNILSPWYGSPVRMLSAMRKGLDALHNTKGKPGFQLDMKFIFVDENPDHIACLKREIAAAGFEEWLQYCEFITGNFEDQYPHCLSTVDERGGFSIFLLDPFGYTDVSMNAMRSIMQNERAEVLFTFMIDFIQRFISSRDQRVQKALSLLEAEGYFTHIGDSFEQQMAARNDTLRLFRNKSGARSVYTFHVMRKINVVEYFLVHLSNNPTALQVLKDSLWKYNNRELSCGFHYKLDGMGFVAPQDFQGQAQLFSMEERNRQQCIELLEDDVMPLVKAEGISFRELTARTMQLNPARRQDYVDFVRLENQLQVQRDGRLTKAELLRNSDIIKRNPQLFFFFQAS
jgi:three-Cys-motif partner protein